MQRYRVNYGLLIGLVVGVIAIGGGIYGLYLYQQSRNAGALIAEADAAEAAGDIRMAKGLLGRYINLREDDVDAFERWAWLSLEISRLPDAEPSERQKGYAALEAFIRKHPSYDEVRREIVDLLFAGQRYKDALSHINYLLNSDPKNGELQAKRLSCLVRAGQNKEAIQIGYKLLGYNSGSAEFDVSKATTPNAPGVYQQVALAIRADRGDPETAFAMVDQLVEVNPEMSEAYVVRGQFLAGTERQDEAEADFDKALELDSKNVEALLAKSQTLMASVGDEEMDEEEKTAAFDEAYKLLKQAAEEAATDWRVYEFLSRLERQRGDSEAAIAHYNDGIEAVEDSAAVQLAFYKARALFALNDLEEVQKTIDQINELGIRQEFIDYLKARLLAANDEWFKASEELLRLRPAFQAQIDIFIELNITLGLCYERLGQLERALEAYDQVLQRAPGNRFAQAGRDRMQQQLNPQTVVDSKPAIISQLITEELQKPKAEQNWQPIFDAVDEYADQPILPPGTAELLKADIFARRKMYAEARRAVGKARKENPDDLRVWRAALRILASDPDRGPVEALKNIPALVKKFGDLPLLRLDKADFLIRIADEDLPQQLLALADGIESWETQQQVQLWKGLAARFQQLRDAESRQIALEKVAALSPNELPTLLDLFQSAIESNDAQQIADAQKQILNLVGSKDDPTYLYTEANQLLWKFASGSGDKSDLDEADQLIERAMLERPDWHKLFQLQALVALARGDKDAALAAFQAGANKGRPDGRPLLMYVSLLLQENRYRDAYAVLEQIAEPVRQRLLGRNYAEVLLNIGELDRALDSADEVIAVTSGDGASQLWYGRFLLRAAASPKLNDERKAEVRSQAEEALAKAVELSPENREAWLARIGLLVDVKRPLEAEKTLREAQLALPEDQQGLLVARSYEWLGRWFDAETAYKQLYERDTDNLAITQALAAFYLGPRYPLPNKEAKATPLLNKLMKAGVQDEELENSTTVLWARRTAAGLLAQDKDYQKLLDAERLLASNVVDGRLSAGDRLLMARILASRPEPQSRVKAIRLLEALQRNQILSVADALRLGQLYYATGDWDACRGQMIETIARNPAVPSIRETYIKMLLEKGGAGNVSDAARQLKKLQELAPQAPSTLQLVVRVAGKLGKQKQALAAISKLLPRDPKSAKPEALISLARLFTDLGDLKRAEALYRAAANRQPTANLFLADFLGTHRDVGQAFELLDSLGDEVSQQLRIRTGLVIVRSRRDEVGDAYDGRVNTWLEKALREDPESIPLQLQLAELRDMQQEYSEAADIYRDLLKQPELEGSARAVVLNNLGYLLALSADDAKSAEEAMGYVSEAIDILGPQADILDTRAVVYTALGQYQAAIADLELSVTDNPSASKYFHMARAQMLADNMSRAVKAWEQAVALGLSRESVAVVEREQFDELEQKISGLSQSAAR
ncbi:MAG: tetratricopeptide repeat protein [Planctomycetota bacterium]